MEVISVVDDKSRRIMSTSFRARTFEDERILKALNKALCVGGSLQITTPNKMMRVSLRDMQIVEQSQSFDLELLDWRIHDG